MSDPSGTPLPHEHADDPDVGTIIRKTSGGYHVKTAGGDVLVCSLRSRLRKELDSDRKSTDRSATFGKQIARGSSAHGLTVGDRVRVTAAPDNEGVIEELLDRTSAFIRRSPGKYARNQVMVANLDRAVIVFSLVQPDIHTSALDRFLVTADSQDIPTTIVLNKLDLTDDPRLVYELPDRYRHIGYDVILTSAETGHGLPEMAEALAGHLCALMGPSGVGKSSLLRELDPTLSEVRVGQISRKYSKGAHTTTDLSLYPVELPGGAEALVVDMPGIRELGLANLLPEELASFFPEMAPLLGECRFGGSCLHDREPGCAIVEAVEAGEISMERYDSYLRMLEYLVAEQRKRY